MHLKLRREIRELTREKIGKSTVEIFIMVEENQNLVQ
jgi:hypothetical protein